MGKVIILITYTWVKVQNFKKSCTFEIQNLKHAESQQNNNNFHCKWSIVLRHTENISENLFYNLPNSGFWGWLSMESQAQNPEFRNIPKNFRPCIHAQLSCGARIRIHQNFVNVRLHRWAGADGRFYRHENLMRWYHGSYNNIHTEKKLWDFFLHFCE